MARSTQHEWFSFRRAFSRWASQPRSPKRQPLRRRLRFEPLEDRRLLALVTVTTLGDTVNFGDGVTSLREAIFATNLVGGADTIEFAASLTSAGAATLTLTQGELAISDSLAINGPGANLLTIDASGNDPTPDSTSQDGDDTNDADGSRVFNIDDGNLTAQIDVSISGLTLTGGDVGGFGVTGSGGAVFSREKLNISSSTISGNFARGSGGGIGTYGGNVTVTSSTISGNSGVRGGGIFASGNVTVTSSTISGNSASFDFGYAISGQGGGIFSNYGNLTVTGSTISGNSADGGGGIYSNYGNLTVTGSTISGNSARDFFGGGIWGGNVTVTDSTISGNSAVLYGGGIWASISAVLSHAIVSGNTRGLAATPNDVTGSVAAAFSLLGVDTGATITDNGGNLIGTAAAPINPLLGPLTNNGGPTMTHALLAGSPAIDAGDPSIVFNPAEHDQRGAPFVRVFDGDGAGGARIDMGAYERQTVAGLNLVVDTAADEHDADYSAGDLSLREAMDLAHGFVGADTITFAAALSGATLTLSQGELAISEALVIDARPLAANVTIDANELSRIFNITATTGDFTLGGLTLTGGRTTASGSAGPGGAIRSLTTDNLTLEQSTVSGSSAVGHGACGGGIFAAGNLALTNSTVSGNSTAGRYTGGGGIYANRNLTLTNSTVSGNSTAGDSARGGGIFAWDNVAITNSTISGNRTTGTGADGGGIFADFGVTLTNSTVSGNSTVGLAADGGGIFARGGNITLTNSTVSGNFTTGDYARGGGIFAWNNVAITNSTISGNRTTGRFADGGGIYGNDGVTLTNSTVSGNSTVGYRADGGGIHAGGNVALNNSTVNGNSTAGDFARGGGIFARANFGPYGGVFPGNLTLTNSTVSENSTAGDFANGGGIFALYDSVTLTNSTVSGNTTTGDSAQGGGIYIYSYATNEPVIVINSIVAGNTASGGNPDLRQENGALTVDYSLIGDTSGLSAGQLAAINLGTGNILNQDALLDPLANNGGPTQTHALLAGSPAIDAGDPSIVFNPAEYDQRGTPFGRVFDGDSNGVARIDIGAYESQPDGTLGDYNRDGGVNAADYVMWRKFLSTSVAPPFSGADGDGDSSVDPDDHGVWRAHFGQTVPPGAGSGAAPELIAPRIQFVEHAEAAATDSNLPHVETDAAAARTSSFAAFGTRFHRPTSTSKTARRPINQHRLAEFRADELLLLAIDCVGRSPQQAFVVHDHEENDEHHADDDIKSQIDESLAVALAEWQ
jgi:hypothetical protein